MSELVEFVDSSDDDDVLGVDNEDHSIRLPRGLLRNLTTGGGVRIASSFFTNMSGLLPGSLPGDNR